MADPHAGGHATTSSRCAAAPDRRRRLGPGAARRAPERQHRLGPARRARRLRHRDTRLDIDLRALRATLYRDGRPVFRAPVGAGAAGTPTPRGDFYVRNRLSRYRSPAYGPVAFGTSARSPG